MRQAVLPAATLLLAGCASMGGEPPIPAGAVAAVHTEANGDVVSEYRVQGQLRMVRVQPKNGPVYYLMDSNGDGRLDSSSRDRNGVSPVYYRIYGW
ncbi:MAG TPA: DUF2782 domain-containing protein [Xanthomonadaceae bacterium]|nr:DUF2782 domain-containing protein [Xanthomonadaceae bacterium]